MTEKESQCAAILAALKLGRRLTVRDARTEFHCERLAARIHELRSDGAAIHTEIIKLGNGKRIAQYSVLA
jgi:hypothetical protein